MSNTTNNFSEEQRIDFIRRALSNARGDDLERAEHSFRGLSEKQLDAQYGETGNTCRQILEEYRDHRRLADESSALFESMLKARVQ